MLVDFVIISHSKCIHNAGISLYDNGAQRNIMETIWTIENSKIKDTQIQMLSSAIFIVNCKMRKSHSHFYSRKEY